MENFYDRTILLIGKDNYNKLKNLKVLLFGIGGVGGYTLEALVRAGVENITIVDNDQFTTSNLNRQILATTDSIGYNKIDIAIARAKNINPNVNIVGLNLFYTPEHNNINFESYDFVIDAIDTISAKCDIIQKCNNLNIKLISCMGTGNKLDASKLQISDIYKTENCKLAKIIRKFCRDNRIKRLPVVFSKEISENTPVIENNGKHSPASISYVPAVAGMLLAQYVILDTIKD